MSIFFFYIIIIFLNNYEVLSHDHHKEGPLATIFDQNSIKFNNTSNCFNFQTNEWSYYDLNVLDKSPENLLNLDSEITLYFNFCQNTTNKCKDIDSLVVLKNKQGDCENLAGHSRDAKNWTFYRTDQINTLRLELKSQTPCKKNENFSTVFEIQCNEDMEIGQFLFDNTQNDLSKLGFVDILNNKTNLDRCENKLSLFSKAACPNNNIYSLWKFYLDYDFIFGMTFILSGVFVCFFGFQNYVTTIYIISIYFFTFIYQIVFTIVDVPVQLRYVHWLSLFSQIIVGIFFSRFILRFPKIKIIIFSFISGICFSNIFYYLAVSKISIIQLQLFLINILIWVGVSLLIFIFLKTCLCMVITSSFLGSYLVVKGVSLYAGGLPYEAFLIDLVNKGEKLILQRNLDKYTIYIYSVLFFTLGLIGYFYQMNFKKINDLIQRNSVQSHANSDSKDRLISNTI